MEGTLTEAAAGTLWRAVLLAAVLASLATAPWSWIVDGLTPSFVLYPLVLLVGLRRMRKGGGTLYFGIAASIFLLVHLPWAWTAFTGERTGLLPEDIAIHRLEWAVMLFVVPLLTAVVGFGAWREARSRPAEGAANRPRFEESAVVRRPADEVFALVGDPRNDTRWTSTVVATRLTSPGPLGAGTTFEQTLRLLGRRFEIAGVVTEYEQGRRLVFEPTSSSLPIKYERGARTFEEVEGGTRITFIAEGRSGLFFNLAEPLVTWAARRAMRAGLAELKEILEARGEPGTSSTTATRQGDR